MSLQIGNSCGSKSVEITLKISEDMLGNLTGKKPAKASAQKPKKLTAEEPKKVAAEKPKKLNADKPKKLTTEKPKKVPAEKPKKVPAEKPKKVATDKPKKIKLPTGKPTNVPAETSKKPTSKKRPISTGQEVTPFSNDACNSITGDFKVDPFAPGVIMKHPVATRAADRENLRREYEYFSYAFKLHDRVRQDDGKPLRPDFEKLADESKDGRIDWTSLPPLKKHQKKFKDYDDAADQVAKFLQKCATDGEKDEKSEARRLMKEEASVKRSRLEGHHPKGQKLEAESTNGWIAIQDYEEMIQAGKCKVEGGAKMLKLEQNSYYGSSGFNW